jgi:hypothetical protein
MCWSENLRQFVWDSLVLDLNGWGVLHQQEQGQKDRCRCNGQNTKPVIGIHGRHRLWMGWASCPSEAPMGWLGFSTQQQDAALKLYYRKSRT